MDEHEQEKIQELEMKLHKDHRGVISTSDFQDPEAIYKRMIQRIRMYHPNTDISMIEKAYHFAADKHKGQKRKSGEPYIIHPLCVGLILADLELDKETITAGILHDVVEDTDTSVEDISREFSYEVALLVDGVTKLGQLDYDKDKVEVQAENLRKMFLAMAKDIRVILIKLADRLHNMRTLRYMTPAKQKEKAKETMEIYAPLAQRLGISKVKIELDDLSLRYLEPEAYYDLVEKVSSRRQERDEYVQKLIDDVSKEIRRNGIEATVEGRAKHFFSIYRKMVNQHKTLDQIFDLFAVRIIVDSIKDCYAALGVIHEMYTPVPGRFKDYIAMPKPNMYQSLHTTVIGPNGSPFEVQIRTYDMHRTSEYGIAAHWKYKESGSGATINQEEAKLSWLRQILEWQQDMSDNKEFMTLLKSDFNLFGDTVFCFTPTGDVKNLPKGSTTIDFAYSIHTAVGNRMVGAKVNDKLVPIDYEIQNGDRIDIITSQNSKGPSPDWLKVVKSTQAKNKINQWFRTQAKEDNINRGHDLLVSNAKSKNIDPSMINKPEYQAVIMRRYGFNDWESALASVGRGGLKEGQVINRMYQEFLKDHPLIQTDDDVLREVNHTDADGSTDSSNQNQNAQHNHRHSSNGVRIKGAPDLPVRFSRCCSPVPGDEIVGDVTRGRGVTVHRTDCVNIINMSDMDRARLIDAEWQVPESESDSGTYAAEINVYANNRMGLLVDISRIFSERKIDIDQMNVRTSKKGTATMEISFAVHSVGELNHLISQIRAIPDIYDIERKTG